MLHSPMGSLPPSGATRSAQVSTPVSKGPIANGADTQVQRSSASVKKESSPTKLLDHSASPSPDAGASQEKASSEGMTVEDNALSSFDFLNEEDSDDDEEEEEEEEGGEEDEGEEGPDITFAAHTVHEEREKEMASLEKHEERQFDSKITAGVCVHDGQMTRFTALWALTLLQSHF